LFESFYVVGDPLRIPDDVQSLKRGGFAAAGEPIVA